MPNQNCLKSDQLLQYFTIQSELGFVTKFKTKWHLKKCQGCAERFNKVQSTWNQYFNPEPEIAPSLIRVYAKLQRDETLILKGWKLENFKSTRSLSQKLFRQGWVYYGAVTSSLLGVMGFFMYNQMTVNRALTLSEKKSSPVAQIEFNQKDKVNVYYVKPELLHHVQFQTNRSMR